IGPFNGRERRGIGASGADSLAGGAPDHSPRQGPWLSTCHYRRPLARLSLAIAGWSDLQSPVDSKRWVAALCWFGAIPSLIYVNRERWIAFSEKIGPSWFSWPQG